MAIDEDIHIPGYDLIEHVAKGGMSSVYRARQHIFERDVALKIMRQDLSEDEHFNERFMQESLIVAKLHHSHIVQVYDVGEVSHHCFIAMEFLSGGVLKAKMANGLPIKKSISVLKQMASALDFAHQKGIVHRDIKPDNIMFREDGAAVLTDFGIAKDKGADMELTQTGAILGTPKYMAPEQIRGEFIGPATDLYSLGVVFYEMLTGFVPFTGPDFISIAHKHLSDPIPELSGRHAPFQGILNKLMAKNPDDRFARAGEIYLALDDLAKHINNPDIEETIFSDGGLAEFTSNATFDSLARKMGEQAPPVNDDGNSDFSGSEFEPVEKTMLLNQATGFNAKKLLPLALGVSVAMAVGVIGWLTLKFAASPSDNPVIEERVVETPPTNQGNPNLPLIQQLLEAAQRNLNADQLTTPASNNAFDKYQQILSMDSGNSAAQSGLLSIARRYAELGMAQLRRGNVSEANRYLQQAQAVNVEAEEVSNLMAAVTRALSETNRAQQGIQSKANALQIEGLLNLAENAARAGNAEDARERYREVLRIDPGNVVAKERLDKL